MSEYSSLKATINANVKTNGNQEITGSVMNSVLNAMVNSLGAGYQFMGVATPTDPGSAQTPDYKCFYLATTPGAYTNLGGLVVVDGEVALLKYDSSWTKVVTGIATADQLYQLTQEIIGNYYTLSGFISVNGAFNPSDSYKCSDFIEYDGISGIKVKNGFSGQSSNLISFYNENKTFISGISNATDIDLSASEIPQGTKYFRVSTEATIGQNVQLYYVSIKVLFDMLNSQDKRNNIRFDAERNFGIAIKNNYDISCGLLYYGYVSAADGLINETTNAKNTGYIPIRGYSKIKVWSEISSVGASVAFYDKDFAYISQLTKAGNFYNTIDLTTSDYDNAEYVIVSYYDRTGVFLNHRCILCNDDSLNKTTNEVVGNLSENQKYDLVDDGYVLYSGGSVNYTTNAKNTGMIRIPGRGILKYHVEINSTGAAVAFYDKDQHYLQFLSVQGADDTHGTIDLSQDAFLNAEYFILSYYDSSHLYASYDGEILFPNDTIGNRVARLENLGVSAKPINILIFGDSITDAASLVISNNKTTEYSVNPDYQNGYYNKDNVYVRYCMWPYLITKYLNTFDVRNYAQWGASYQDQNDADYPRKSLSYQIEVAINDIPNDNKVFPTDGDYVPDIIIFALGVNDGKPNDTFESAMAKTIMTDGNIDVDATLNNLDRTKFCEAARYAFLKIKKQFPQSLCMCILPIQRAANDIQISGVNNELRKMADRYSMITIDGAGQCGIIRDLEKNNALGENLKDGLHPNDKGQNLYTRMVVGAIKSHYVNMGMMNP